MRAVESLVIPPLFFSLTGEFSRPDSGRVLSLAELAVEAVATDRRPSKDPDVNARIFRYIDPETGMKADSYCLATKSGLVLTGFILCSETVRAHSDLDFMYSDGMDEEQPGASPVHTLTVRRDDEKVVVLRQTDSAEDLVSKRIGITEQAAAFFELASA